MSADNGIYIAKFPSGYRVAYGSAIENVSYYPEGSEERKDQLNIYFGKSKLITDEKEAILHAHELAKEYDYLEYGVSLIGEFEEFIMPEEIEEPRKDEWFHLRSIKPTEMQLWGGETKICNLQGKWSEELAEFIRMANLGIHVHREEIKMRIEAMLDYDPKDVAFSREERMLSPDFNRKFVLHASPSIDETSSVVESVQETEQT